MCFGWFFVVNSWWFYVQHIIIIILIRMTIIVQHNFIGVLTNFMHFQWSRMFKKKYCKKMSPRIQQAFSKQCVWYCNFIRFRVLRLHKFFYRIYFLFFLFVFFWRIVHNFFYLRIKFPIKCEWNWKQKFYIHRFRDHSKTYLSVCVFSARLHYSLFSIKFRLLSFWYRFFPVNRVVNKETEKFFHYFNFWNFLLLLTDTILNLI